VWLEIIFEWSVFDFEGFPVRLCVLPAYRAIMFAARKERPLVESVGLPDFREILGVGYRVLVQASYLAQPAPDPTAR
jgi:hypothetical protein